jgi:hypothetical protein
MIIATMSSTSLSSTEKDLATFPQFGKLPIELQLIVWQETVPGSSIMKIQVRLPQQDLKPLLLSSDCAERHAKNL